MPIKKIYLCPTPGGHHNLYNVFIKNPPEGYEVISPEIKKSKTYSFLSKSKFARFIYRKLNRLLRNPIVSDAEAFASYKIPENISLIFSPGRVVLKKDIPHVIEIVDKVVALAGNDLKLFEKNKEFLKDALLSSDCRKIICWNNACKQDFINEFNSPEIDAKLETVYLTKPLNPKKSVVRNFNKKEINLLFMGSINNPDDFLIKGGLETLEVFRVLSKKYSNLHLYVRCAIPKNIKDKYSKLANLHLIENFLSSEELEKLYLDADIFMTPAHNLNALAPIEAMAYGLPLIGINTWAVNEIIEDSLNGFLVNKSEKIAYEKEKIHLDIRNKKFLKQIQEIDEALINRLVEKTELLINNPPIRKKLGEYGRLMVESGKFSFKLRNQKLKKIFDEAIKS